MMLGRAFGERWSSASSEHKLGPGAVYLDMDYCETIEEATNMSFTFVDDLSASDLASIWTRASQLMKQRSRKKKPENYDDYQLEKLTHRLNLMFSITMGGLEIFGPKDLSQTALAFARIVVMVDDHPSQGTPEQILRDILVGPDSQRKATAFQSIANASTRFLSKSGPRYLSDLAHANAMAGAVPEFADGSTLFDRIAARIPRVRKFDPRDLLRVLRSFERAGESTPAFLGDVAGAVVAPDRLGGFAPRELSDVLLAFAGADGSYPRLFERIADHIAAERGSLREFGPRELSDVLRAFAEAGHSHPRLFERVADRLVGLDDRRDFSPGKSPTRWGRSRGPGSRTRGSSRIWRIASSPSTTYGHSPRKISPKPYRHLHPQTSSTLDFSRQLELTSMHTSISRLWIRSLKPTYCGHWKRRKGENGRIPQEERSPKKKGDKSQGKITWKIDCVDQESLPRLRQHCCILVKDCSTVR